MSHAIRPTPTRMLVCDLCDEEIKDQEDGAESRGNVMTGYSPIVQVTNRTRWALLCWGRSRTRRDEKTVSYDFHGRCIAKLVEDAIALRDGGAR